MRPMGVLYKHELEDDEDDARVYDENVEKYFRWLEQQAEKEGITIEYEQSLHGGSYYADDAEAEDFMLRSLDFWEWYQAGL